MKLFNFFFGNNCQWEGTAVAESKEQVLELLKANSSCNEYLDPDKEMLTPGNDFDAELIEEVPEYVVIGKPQIINIHMHYDW